MGVDRGGGKVREGDREENQVEADKRACLTWKRYACATQIVDGGEDIVSPKFDNSHATPENTSARERKSCRCRLGVSGRVEGSRHEKGTECKWREEKRGNKNTVPAHVSDLRVSFG